MQFGRPDLTSSLTDKQCFSLLINHIVKNGRIKTIRLSQVRGTENYKVQRYKITIHKDGHLINLCELSLTSYRIFNDIILAIESERSIAKQESRIIFGMVGRIYEPEVWRFILNEIKFAKLKVFL